MSLTNIQIGKNVFYASVGICLVSDKIEMDGNEYFVLQTLDKKNESTIYIPLNNEKLINNVCDIVSEEEIFSFMDESKKHSMDWIENRRERQETFLNILRTNDFVKILLMIKCLYLKNDLLKKDNKRLSTCDNDILLKARFIIEQIVSYVLNVDAIKAKEIFEQRIEI